MGFFSVNNIIIYCVLLLLIVSYFFITDTTINLNKYEIAKCDQTIFEYDLIEYYTLNLDNLDNRLLVQKDTVKRKILNDYFKDIKDSINLKHVEKYYIKSELNLQTLKFVKSYICKNNINSNNWFSECMPTFRDIMIFKRQSKTVGIIKICFECNISNVVSSEYNSEMFNDEEMDILEKFLIDGKNAEVTNTLNKSPLEQLTD